jgi:hypothetical protein
MLVIYIFMLPLSCHVCLGIIHYGLNECVFVCMCKHIMKNKEHFYVTIIVFYSNERLLLGLCVFCLSRHLSTHASLFFHPFVLLCVCMHQTTRSKKHSFVAIIVYCLSEPFMVLSSLV